MAVAGAPWQLEFENVEQRCGYLLTSGIWSDCTFIVGLETNQATLPAHKLVLAMASPVFAKMLYGGLSECNELKITDVQPEAFRALLQYIYTGNTDIESLDMAWGLLRGAKKYMLPHLLTKCNRYICSVLAPRNVCGAYALAHDNDEKTIMDKCIQIISANTKQILSDSSFEDVQLSTLIKLCSLDNLDIDSELDLFNAVEKYAKAEQKRQRMIRPVATSPSEKLSELRVLPPTAEEKLLSSSQAAETADKENLKEEGTRPTIRAAREKIRFLSLSPQEFAAVPPRSGLFTQEESLAVLLNISTTNSAEPMPSGFSECRNRRQPRSDSVEEGPFANPRPKPSTESVGVAATKLLTPVEIVSGLLSNELETMEQALRAARDMPKPSFGLFGISTLDHLVATGGIPPLVAALNHSSAGVQNDAASVISNIANCGSKNTEALITAGAIPVLVGLLRHGGAMAEQAARALGDITRNGNNSIDAVLNAGTPAALLVHMQPSTPSGPLATYLRTYEILCLNGPFSPWTQFRFEQLSPAVPYIEKLLLLEEEQVLAEACSVLTRLAGGADMNPQLFTAPLAARITALLRPAAAAPDVQSSALETVVAMLESRELRELCLGAGCLDYIIDFLKCGNPSNVERAAAAAYYILRTTSYIQPALDKGILDTLVPALTKGSMCEFRAVSAIETLCLFGSRAQLCELAASSALLSFCRMMTDQ